MNYWLMKTEPEVFSIDDLAKARDKTTCWEGVRNYQARNFMRDEMKLGDQVLIYHSNTSPPGIAGIARVVKEAYPDHSAFDPSSKYFDVKSKKESATWMMVDVQFVMKAKKFLSLDELKANPKVKELLILRKGNRLSITPVEKKHFEIIAKLL